MALSDKKSIYHSALVNSGDVVVTITSDGPQQSKFQGKPDFIGLKHEGSEHILSLENESCGTALTGLKGQTVMLRASGRDGDACIEVFDAPDDYQGPAPKRASAPPPRQPAGAPREQRVAQPPPRQPAQAPKNGASLAQSEAEAFTKARHHAARIGIIMRLAMKASEDACKHDFAHGTNEDQRAFAITMFIEMNKMITAAGLPVVYPVPKQPAKREPELPADPEPDPAPDPRDPRDLDDIPF